MLNTTMTKKEALEMLSGKLSRYFGVTFSEANNEQLYKAVVMTVRDILLEKRKSYHYKIKEAQGKRVYYLCMEFLLGRSLKNNVYNLGIEKQLTEVLKNNGFAYYKEENYISSESMWQIAYEMEVIING